MVMEVCLMADVADLGAEGDVVKVADGYARNCLIPRKLAAPVTEATRRKLAKIRKEREISSKAALEAAQKMSARLEGVSCTIAVKTGQDGKLYGSVSASDIVEALEKQGVNLDKNTLQVEQPIKELGVFDVKVKLHADVEASVKVWVVEE
jgi:large subunit ribosomal protein L9